MQHLIDIESEVARRPREFSAASRVANDQSARKVLPCPKRFQHEWKSCVWVHAHESVRRRDPARYAYTGLACPSLKTAGSCPLGDACPYAHNVFEYWLHPTRYRTQLCTDGDRCKRAICFFAHNLDQLRTPECTPFVPAQTMVPPAGGSAAEQPPGGAPPPPRRRSEDIMRALRQAQQVQQEGRGAGAPAEADAAAQKALTVALQELALPRQHPQLSPPVPALREQPQRQAQRQGQLPGAVAETRVSRRTSPDRDQSGGSAGPLPAVASVQGYSMPLCSAGLLGPVTASAQLQHPSAAARLAAAHALQPAGAGAAASEQLALLQSALRMADSGPLVGHTLQGTFAGCLLGLHG